MESATGAPLPALADDAPTLGGIWSLNGGGGEKAFNGGAICLVSKEVAGGLKILLTPEHCTASNRRRPSENLKRVT